MVDNMKRLIEFVYTWNAFTKPLENANTFIKNAILCPKLDAVRRANEMVSVRSGMAEMPLLNLSVV
jgi:hypothetical protein